MASLIDPTPRTLGSLGEVGPLALGQWRFTNEDPAAAQALIEAALDAGLNLIHTADVYGLDWGGTGFGSCEALLGAVLAAAPGLRDRMVLATKGGIVPPTPYDSSPRAMRRAVAASQRRLGVDVIDLWQVHRPDLLTHPADVAETLGALRAEGTIREVGRRTTPRPRRALQAHLPFPLVSTQPEYSAVHLDPLRDGTFDACMRDGVVALVWSPLAGGRLATRRRRPGPSCSPCSTAWPSGRGSIGPRSPWPSSLAHPGRPVAIIGTQNPERIRSALDALRRDARPP